MIDSAILMTIIAIVTTATPQSSPIILDDDRFNCLQFNQLINMEHTSQPSHSIPL